MSESYHIVLKVTTDIIDRFNTNNQVKSDGATPVSPDCVPCLIPQ